jgi:hypothetical protein
MGLAEELTVYKKSYDCKSLPNFHFKYLGVNLRLG